MADLRPAARLPLLLLGMLSLVAGVLAGLARLGWVTPDITAEAASGHGVLMISAFLGTVISLERAVALARRWAYLAPLVAGFSGLALLAGAPLLLSQVLAIAAATIMVGASLQVLKRVFATFTVVLVIGAACWLVGSLVWLLDGSLGAVVPWWLGFLILTIAGERLEMTRFLPTPPGAAKLFALIVTLILVGAAIAFWRLAGGLALFSAGMLALALWLLRYDLARHNVHQQGLTRFIAVCLLSGYGWLALAGGLGLAGGLLPGHPWRDATLHGVCLGFVFSMILGHAPIIFPAVVRVKIPYTPVLYLPLVVLHGSLVLRVCGSLADRFPLRHLGGLLNGVALALFIVTVVVSVIRGRKETPGGR